ncbi:Tetratricopeptide repeat [Micractinium conductrix]|uniref:Tetratricopeptide repeat n=1 Tax=Micractinium conductrix TaxID=554055 RepID=A0A2P6VKF4_9CHLO|nr:Tetratricopeptide repeat [Micractinium conductrix]|eukprot:PSC74586.1 Tetratricopeptide repeat [Micractinium conductrix]
MRAQALVDGKNFSDALRDFDAALALLPADGAVDRARLLSGRGLAYEGLGDWPAALQDYKGSLALAGGDPYVQNSVGNCHASLGEWQAARQAFLESSEGFQRAAGFRRGRSTTPRLDGAVFAASNAALMLAQLGDEEGAMHEMEGVARRAPGSVDMRAALAALYWRRGDEARAESEWEFACNSITTGCTKYTDSDWLLRIRRWPPIMVEYLSNFLKLRSSPK